MKPGAKTALVVFLVSALAALGAAGWWFWHEHLEQRMNARWKDSEAAADNPMLAATMFLRQQKIEVAGEAKLADLPLRSLRDGTIIIAEPDGLVTETQSRALLAWVGKGNTLVMRPRYLRKSDGEADTPGAEADQAAPPAAKPDAAAAAKPAGEAAPDATGEDGEDGEDDGDGEDGEDAEQAATKAAPAGAELRTLVESDPIGQRYGVRTKLWAKPSVRCGALVEPLPAEAASAGRTLRSDMRLACLTPPGSAWPLELDTGGEVLVSLKGKAAAPLWGDRGGFGLRVYAEGKGHVVLLPTNYFDNRELDEYDHAEALLALVRLNPRAARVLIVQHVDVLPWYRALWSNFALAVLGAALFLALLLWVAVRRFGPLLPGPRAERRSLVEHIDASAAWLWHAQGGRGLLIDAVRDDALAALARRAPELAQLPQQEKLHALVARSGLPHADLDAALYWLAGHTSDEFTLQIQTLQALRKHFDE
ncbi:MAG: DUF4350 domain-containing protein [Pseudomonadota bacterium]